MPYIFWIPLEWFFCLEWYCWQLWSLFYWSWNLLKMIRFHCFIIIPIQPPWLLIHNPSMFLFGFNKGLISSWKKFNNSPVINDINHIEYKDIPKYFGNGIPSDIWGLNVFSTPSFIIHFSWDWSHTILWNINRNQTKMDYIDCKIYNNFFSLTSKNKKK